MLAELFVAADSYVEMVRFVAEADESRRLVKALGFEFHARFRFRAKMLQPSGRHALTVPRKQGFLTPEP